MAREITKNIRQEMLHRLNNEEAQIDKAKSIKDPGVQIALKEACARIAADREATITKAKQIVDSHFIACRAIDLPMTAAIGTVVDMYFNCEPPFDAERKKVNEYRDAISLLDLDTYANKEGVDIIVATADIGCLRFCESTKHLIAVQRIDDMLESLLSREALETLDATEIRLNAAVDLGNVLFKSGVFGGISNLSELAQETSDLKPGLIRYWHVELLGEPKFLQMPETGRHLHIRYQDADDFRAEYSVEGLISAQVKVIGTGNFRKRSDNSFHTIACEATGEVTLTLQMQIGFNNRTLTRFSYAMGGYAILPPGQRFPQIVPPDPEVYESVGIA